MLAVVTLLCRHGSHYNSSAQPPFKVASPPSILTKLMPFFITMLTSRM